MNRSPLGPLLHVTCGKVGVPKFGPRAVGGVGHEVAARAAVLVVAPDVPQVQPVPDLVGGGAAEVERRARGAGVAEGAVQDHDAVGVGRAARELRVAEQAVTRAVDEVAAGPDVEVPVRGPRVGAAGRVVLDVVGVGVERRVGVDVRMMPVVGLPDGSVVASLNVIRASPISGWKAAGVDDLSALVARKSWLRIVDLAVDLCVGEVLRRVAVDDVDHDGDLGAPGAQRGGAES